MKLRPATMNDAKMLFEWRNDPQTRAMSNTQDPVAWEAHVNWLEASLANPARDILIADVEGPVGTVRRDHDASGTIGVSMTMAPEARGRKLSGPMMDMATSDPGRYTCGIRADNPASRRGVERAGFGFTHQSDGMDFFIKERRKTVMTPEQIDAKLKLIDAIEAVRNKNNVNWMNLLRVALRADPEGTLELVRQINTKDNEISELFAKLGEPV
jgi:RimJ/RimL family protein N-acetyltransferase